tara:strand:- start:395 stop:616 length:222 start_codon:yes stop_codon:yes gene_type:complete
MSNLELEIRGYIVIFGMAFLISFLSGCGNTISGIGSDITSVGKKVVTWQESKSEPKQKVILEDSGVNIRKVDK